MRAVFVDTNEIYRAQQDGRDADAPLIVYDLDQQTAERTNEVRIVGPAVVRFEMSPPHNLARVWVEAERAALAYDGAATQWVGRKDRQPSTQGSH